MFGVLEVDGPDEVPTLSADKPRRLLSLLLLRANRWVPEGELIDAVWPAGAPVSAQGNIKSYVTQVRQLLAPFDERVNRIERRDGAYRITVDDSELDVLLFRDLFGRGRAALERRDADRAVQHLEAGLSLWRGEPFESVDVEAARFEVARLTELRWSARESLAEAYVATGRPHEAVALLRAMIAEDPLQEHVWLCLMRTLHDSGRRAEALNAYQFARRALVRELGIEPGSDLTDLHERMLKEDAPRRTAQDPREGSSEAAGRGAPESGPEPLRRRTPLLVVGVLALTALLIAGMVLSDRDEPPAGSPAADATTTAADRHGWGTPRHAEEFSADLGRDWRKRGPEPGRDGNGRVLPGRVEVREGVLTITGLPNGDTGHVSRDPASLHGRWEARVRAPTGCACYRPVLTLWPQANDSPDGGEIVYLESFDGERRSAEFFLASANVESRLHSHREIDLTVWNHFAVEWTPQRVVGYVNGEEWFHTADPAVLPPRAMRPTIKLDLIPDGEVTKTLMEVDWIREYPPAG